VDGAGGAHDLSIGVVPQVHARINRNAVSADRDAGLVDVAERLAVAGLDDRGDVYPDPIGVARECVGQADVHVAVRRLCQLRQLGRLGAAEIPHSVGPHQVDTVIEFEHLLVELDATLCGHRVDPADQLRVAAQVGEDAPGGNPLRAEYECEV